MDWDKLRIFHAVSEAGSFTHAGDTLNLSQSAVSRQISTLEESLGLSLFHRHARGLVLTEEGEILHKAAKKIFGELALIEGRLADSRQLPSGSLIITAAPFLGSTWLAPKLGQLKRKNPELQLTLLLDDRIFNLAMREADAAVRLYKSEQPDLVQRHLTDIHFHICGSKEYLAEHGTPQNAKDLQSHVLLGFPDNVPAPFADSNWLFRVAGQDPHSSPNIIKMNSLYGIYEAVQAGVGLAALPDYLVKETPGVLKIMPDIERAPVGMYFAYPEERKHSKRIAIFRDFLLESIEQTTF